MLKYYNTWQFKHPNANDFFRIMEKTSGLELDWFKEYFINTTHYPDYAVKQVGGDDDKTYITLSKLGVMPMPVDLIVTYKDGSKSYVNIPLRIMRGNKESEFDNMHYILGEDWPWTHPEYQLTLDFPLEQVSSVSIDPSGRMIDLNRTNNTWEAVQLEED